MDEEIKKHFEKHVKNINKRDVAKAIAKGREIIAKVKASEILARELRKVQLLWILLKDWFNNTYPDVPWRTIASISFTLLYILNPVDLIPDFLPGIGFLDDLAIIILAWNFLEKDIRTYCLWKMDKDEEVKALYEEIFIE